MHRIFTLALITFSLISGASLLHAEVTHPRLFINDARIKEIRQQVNTPGTTHAAAFAQLKAKIDPGLEKFYDPNDNKQYQRSYFMQGAAMLYQITQEKKYAEMAFEAFKLMNEQPDPADRAPWTGYGLSRATQLIGMGITYDWCQSAWSDEQRDYFIKQTNRSIDAMAKFSHANFQNPGASNWVGVCRGGELVAILGTGQEESRADRVKFLKSQLERHIRVAFTNIGHGQEGYGYIGYGGIFTYPAAIALRDVGDDTLYKLAQSKNPWKGVMFAGSSQLTIFHDGRKIQRRYIQTGVSNTGINDEGYASIMLSITPDEDLPYYKWFYDRHMGLLSQGPEGARFDHDRPNAIWCLAFYPADVQPKNPVEKFGHSVSDNGGLVIFRNGWAGPDDIQITIDGDSIQHPRAWDQSMATTINVLGLGNRFIGGPGKDREAELFSGVLVNGQMLSGKESTLTGKLDSFEAYPSGGYAIVDGGQKYKKLGAEVKRHMLVDFSGKGAPAVFSTYDVGDKKLGFQASLGDNSDRDPTPKASSGTESGRPYFLLRGENDAWLKGWVLHPTDAKIDAKDPLTVREGEQLWIVMAMGKGTPPTAQITGEAMNSVIKINAAEVKFDNGKIVSNGRDVQPPALPQPAGAATTTPTRPGSSVTSPQPDTTAPAEGYTDFQLAAANRSLTSAKNSIEKENHGSARRLLEFVIRTYPGSEPAAEAQTLLDSLPE